jgi:2'-5' RNA ligase
MKENWFIGLPVDAGRWLAPLVRSAPSCVRLFHPEDVHMTVAFLGAVGPEAASRAWATVLGYQSSPIELALGPLRAMGNPRRPSALSVLVESGNDRVAALIGALRGPACAAADARPDDRPPLPHITIARPSRSASAEERRAAVAWALAQPAVGAKVVLDRLVLFTWATDRRERQFRIVEQKPLSGSA